MHYAYEFEVKIDSLWQKLDRVTVSINLLCKQRELTKAYHPLNVIATGRFVGKRGKGKIYVSF